jgi:PAS domain S-box-containing protein
MNSQLYRFSRIYLNFSLQNKFLIPTIAVIFISFLSVGIYFIHDQRNKQEIRLQEKAERISLLLLSSNLESIWDVDLKNLERNCQAFIEDEEITRIVIIDTFNDEDVLVNLSNNISGSKDIVVTADFIRGDHKIAELEVVFSNYYFEQDLAQLRNTLVILSVLMFFLMIGIVRVVSQIALRPLKGMMSGVHHLTEGDLSFQIPVQSHDELGKLAISFNSMAEELNHYHGNLQELVEKRTAELRKTNAKLHQEIMERERYEDALRKSEEKYRELVQNANSIILRWDTEGKVTFFNEYAQAFFGFQEDEIIGRHVVGTIVPETESTGRDLRPLMDDICKNPQKYEYNVNENMRKDGSKVWVAWTNKILTDKAGNPVGALSIGADITERKKAEEELQRAKEEAETANKAKSAFLANMSHELRTPLNAILGFTQIMERNPDISSEKENLRIIQRSGSHLLTLINQVLDLSKIEAGYMNTEENCFDLFHLLDELENMLSLKADKRDLALLFNCMPYVPRHICADEVKLRQVLINLLSNSIKFTDEGSVSLRISVRNNRDSKEKEKSRYSSDSLCTNGKCMINFEIEDTGHGIAPEEMDRLFEAFGQTATGREAQEGTGLGLAISRKFIQLMGGEMHVESEVGRGTKFSFEILVQVADADDVTRILPTHRPIGLEPNQPRYRILIVDDKWDNRQLLIKLLEPFGFDLREAGNGQEAIDIWKTCEPHLIWMDMRMPVMDGYEATKRIRAQASRIPRTVIIAVTANVLEEGRTAVMSTGCDDIVIKPFREADIIEMLQKHLNVKFLYAADEIPTEKFNLKSVELRISTADFDTLPKEMVMKFKESVAALEMDTALTVIEEMREINLPLADALQRIAEEYRFDKLQKLLEQS